MILVSIAGVLRPWLVPALCKHRFISDVREYESFYRQNNYSCYGLWDPDIESPWFLGMERDDYAFAAFELARHEDPKVRMWARTVLMSRYLDSPWARRYVYSLIGDRKADFESRIDAALTIIDWDDSSHAPLCSEIFALAPPSSARSYLGRQLYQWGHPQVIYQVLESPQTSVEDKFACARILIRFQDRTRIKEMKALFEVLDPADATSIELASYLAASGDREIFRALLKALPSAKGPYRVMVMESLQACASSKPRLLTDLEDDDDPDVQWGRAELQSWLK